MRFVFSLLCVWILALPALAQDNSPAFVLGNDLFDNGRVAQASLPDLDDAFLAGARSTISAPLTGSAHMVGRWIAVQAGVGGNVYALGQRITVDAAVQGDVNAIAQNLILNAPISGDLRFFGSDLSLSADISGDAVISTEYAQINAPIAGDLLLITGDVDFGTDARVTGRLLLYETEIGKTVVPETVLPADRIERHLRTDAPKSPDLFERRKAKRPAAETPSVAAQAVGWLADRLLVALILGLLLIALSLLLPRLADDLVDEAQDTPGQALLWGAVSLSTLLGLMLLLVMTLWGAFIAPVILFTLGLLAVSGFLVGAYILGRFGIRQLMPGPATKRHHIAAAGLGACLTSILIALPFLGLTLQILICMLGAGALILKTLQPGLMTTS